MIVFVLCGFMRVIILCCRVIEWDVKRCENFLLSIKNIFNLFERLHFF
jgi:hypothetical protein